MNDQSGASIRVERLTRTYGEGPSAVTVFSDLDLQVARGESVAIVGESGEGKSTLLHLLGGLDRPTSGKVWFGDRDIFTLREPELASFRNATVGFVWQMNSLLPEFTALENVMMPLLVRGQPRAEAAERARKRLGEVGLTPRKDNRAGQLSGGEQQRVALARALVGDPEVLLADEPTGNLDSRTGQAIQALLGELQQANGLTAVIVTHNVAFAKACDRVLQLEKGTLAPWHGRLRSPAEGGSTPPGWADRDEDSGVSQD